jgi:hypothetical protein
MAVLAAMAISLPALASAGDQNTVKLANTVANCLQVYYAYAGHWPASWDEIEQSGIHQVALVNSAGISIDPDVYEIPVAGETVWMSGNEQNGSYVLEIYLPQDNTGSASPDWQKPWVIDASKTYDQKFPRYDELNEQRGLDVRWTPHLANDARLRQFAITGLISDAFLQYHLNFGKYPTSMSQLIDAGYSPVDWSSINPLTNKPFRFDGSANDLLVLVGNEGDYYSDSSINVFPVLEDGEPLYAVGSFS